MIDFKRMSLQEYLIGCVVPAFLIFKLGWMALILSILSGLLWVLGGTYHKAIRRFGVPVLILIFVSTKLFNPIAAAISLALGIGILHMGDGFPDYRPTTASSGSWLGRQVEKIFPQDDMGGPLTKWLIALIFQLSLIPYFIF